MRNARTTHAKSFTGRTSLTSKFSAAPTIPDEDGADLVGTKRPLVANLANVPTVKIASYSKRNPETLFYPQGQAPRPSDSEGHGGLFYDVKDQAKLAWSNKTANVVPFARKVENRKEQMKRIEAVTKKAKAPGKAAKRSAAKTMAKENAELLFSLLHGDGAVAKTARQRRWS